MPRDDVERRGKLSRSTKKRTLQHDTFIDQTIASLVIYVPSLLIAFFLINFNKGWNYSDDIVLNNLQFNVNIFTIMAIGAYSMVLAMFNSHDQNDYSSAPQLKCRIFSQVIRGICLTMVTVLSIVIFNITMLIIVKEPMAFISVTNSHETHIIRAVQISSNQSLIAQYGCLASDWTSHECYR